MNTGIVITLKYSCWLCSNISWH